MKFLQGLGVVAILGYIMVVVALVAGWIMNLLNVCQASWDVVTIKLALQLVGIFVAPLGALLGWFL